MPAQPRGGITVEALIDRCRSGDPDVQVDAALRLLDLGAEQAAAELSRLVASSDAAVRATAARVLGHLGAGDRDAAGRALVTALGDREALVRSEAADALGILRVADAVPQLRQALTTDREPLVRASAAESLGELADASALPELVAALRDEDEAVRGYAASAIGLVGDEGMLDELRAALSSERSLRARAELLGARHRLGADESLGELLELLGGADRDTAETLLNIVEELAGVADTRVMSAALRDVGERHPELAGHADSIRARLR